MITFSVKPIRLLLQIITADAFIGERDKTACGKAIDIKRQGNCGRLQIVTSTGNCVWRLSKGMVSAILELWEKLEIHFPPNQPLTDRNADQLARDIARTPDKGHSIALWSRRPQVTL